MLVKLSIYKEQAVEVLKNKDHISSGIGSDLFLQIILFISATFLLTSLIMTIYMVINRKRKNEKNKIQKKLINKYQDFLSNFLLLPSDNSFVGIQTSTHNSSRLDTSDIRDPYKRYLLAKEIYALQRDLSGQQKTQLHNYFLGLGIPEDVGHMLRSRHWTKKVTAFQLIGAFHLVEYDSELLQFIDNENQEISTNAIIAKIRLDNSLDILSQVKRDLNDWDMHKIYNETKNNRKLTRELHLIFDKQKECAIQVERLQEYIPNPETEQLVFS